MILTSFYGAEVVWEASHGQRILNAARSAVPSRPGLWISGNSFKHGITWMARFSMWQ